MKKTGLKEMKKINRQCILQAMFEKQCLSRIEISKITKLAPSTVSGIVNELLNEEILVESGIEVSTSGRNRKQLMLNPQLGTIAIAEVKRQEIVISFYDFNLNLMNRLKKKTVCNSGNELLNELNGMLQDERRLKGIGLLIHEDMQATDLSVMYDTGYYSAPISIKQALITQYKVKVIEEYSQTMTVVNTKTVSEAELNNLHITVGEKVRATVSIDGGTVPIKQSFCDEHFHEELSQDEFISKLDQFVFALSMLFTFDELIVDMNTRKWLLSQEQIERSLVKSKGMNVVIHQVSKNKGFSSIFAEEVRTKLLFQ